MDADGKVSFSRAGTVTVTAEASDGSGVSASTKITYVPLAESVTILGPDGKAVTDQTVAIDSESYQLTAIAGPEGAAQEFTWTSSDPDTASVDADGKVSFSRAGTVTVTAEASDGSGVSASVTLRYVSGAPQITAVKILDPDGEEVTGKTLTIHSAEYQLTAAAEPEEAAPVFTWSSGNEGIASVDADGKVSFRKAGTVTITVEASDAADAENRAKAGNGISASVTLIYVPSAESVTILGPDGEAVSGQTVTVESGTYQLTASAGPEGAAQNFTWTSSDPETAVVDAGGNVTFLKAGTVTNTAEAANGSGVTASVTLTYEGQPVLPEPEEDHLVFYRLFAERELPATGFSGNAAPGAQPRDVHYRPLGMRILIPTLNVDTELVTVPETESSWQVQWLGERTGLLEGSALPGEGISVAAAHNTLNRSEYGPFALLGTLEVNDRIMVSGRDGSMKLFRVYANELLDPDDMERVAAVAALGENTLVLVTCENESARGGYLNRRVIFAGQ